MGKLARCPQGLLPKLPLLLCPPGLTPWAAAALVHRHYCLRARRGEECPADCREPLRGVTQRLLPAQGVGLWVLLLRQAAARQQKAKRPTVGERQGESYTAGELL